MSISNSSHLNRIYYLPQKSITIYQLFSMPFFATYATEKTLIFIFSFLIKNEKHLILTS